MENIKEELRQLIKDKILSTIMEGKNSKKREKREKPVHPPRGPYQHKIKTYGKGGDDTTINTQRRREGREQAAELDEASGPSDGMILTHLIQIEAQKLAANPKPTSRGPSVHIKDLTAEKDLLPRFKSLMSKYKKPK